MICPGCKHQNLPEALFCSMCGKGIGPSEGTASSGTGSSGSVDAASGPPLFYKDTGPVPLKKGMAIVSLVIGIVSILTLSCAMIGAIFGIVLGAMAHAKATKEPLEYGGKGIAVAGIVTNAVSIPLAGILGIIAAIALPNMYKARAAVNEASVITRLESISSAEYRFRDKAKRYGTLPELETAGLLDSSHPALGTYRFDLRITNGSFEALATPVQNFNRQRSFYVTTDYVVRAGYKNGREANVHDPPIYH